MNCVQCNKKLIKWQKKFCSRSCAVAFNNKNRKKNRPNCLICGVQIKHGTRFTCSRECHHKKRWEEKKQEIIKGLVSEPKTLKRFLIEKFGHKCSVCSNTEWMEKSIPLEIDHIDGDHKNNRPENIRLICPNCHAQTPTYGIKNKGRGREWRRLRYAAIVQKVEHSLGTGEVARFDSD